MYVLCVWKFGTSFDLNNDVKRFQEGQEKIKMRGKIFMCRTPKYNRRISHVVDTDFINTSTQVQTCSAWHE